MSGSNLKNLDYFSASDPQCTLKSRSTTIDYSLFNLVGETEVVDNNLNPQWIKHFNVHYVFHKDKELFFQVWNYNTHNDKDLIGETKILLSSIMVSQGMSVEREL